jgi:hypothetical protein
MTRQFRTPPKRHELLVRSFSLPLSFRLGYALRSSGHFKKPQTFPQYLINPKLLQRLIAFENDPCIDMCYLIVWPRRQLLDAI